MKAIRFVLLLTLVLLGSACDNEYVREVCEGERCTRSAAPDPNYELAMQRHRELSAGQLTAADRVMIASKCKDDLCVAIIGGGLGGSSANAAAPVPAYAPPPSGWDRAERWLDRVLGLAPFYISDRANARATRASVDMAHVNAQREVGVVTAITGLGSDIVDAHANAPPTYSYQLGEGAVFAGGDVEQNDVRGTQVRDSTDTNIGTDIENPGNRGTINCIAGTGGAGGAGGTAGSAPGGDGTTTTQPGNGGVAPGGAGGAGAAGGSACVPGG